MADVNALFNQLLEMSWRGLSFPITELTTDVEQDHVEHKWPDRDGAHVEATGRQPIVVTARAAFRNGIVPGKNESWQNQNQALYPQQYRQFLFMCADRTVGILTHPELGNFNAKLRRMQTHWDPNKRDGVDVDCVWVESTETQDDLTKVLATPSPASSASQTATDLDSYVPVLVPPPVAPPKYEGSFSDLMRAIQSVPDQIGLLNKRTGGAIDHFVYRVQALEDSVNANRDVTQWPVIASAERAKAAAYSLKQTLLAANKPVALYAVPAPVTLGSLAATLKQDPNDLVKLNPSIAGLAVIPGQILIRYYPSGASTTLALGGSFTAG
jgi:hypothetical protein